MLVRRKIVLYACKVKEAANGSRRCALNKAWQAFQVVAEGRFAKHVRVNEQNRAPQNGQDEAQGQADKEELALKLEGWRVRGSLSLLALHNPHHLPQRLSADPACACEGMVKDEDQEQDLRHRYR